MSMLALNQLVARSIIDPAIVQAFSAGRINDILGELDFSTELRTQLANLKANTWAEFAVLAYRSVKAAEPVPTRIELPSPVEGLMGDQAQTSKEHVA
ncbi:MAG: hypothetical protein GTO18_19760 [Anaerolineales bacterium]|nr:hypothetical protein [Anaerolineales bacterium]